METNLLFELRNEYGRERYYPINQRAKALVWISGRKCFYDKEIGTLRQAGFTVDVDTHLRAPKVESGASAAVGAREVNDEQE